MKCWDCEYFKIIQEPLRLEYPMMPMFKENQKEWGIKTEGYRKAEEVIKDAPSIDIVRCAECKWGKPYSDKQLECDALGLGGLKFPDDFCSYGQKGDENVETD